MLQMGVVEAGGEMKISTGITLLPVRPLQTMLHKLQGIGTEFKVIFNQQERLCPTSPGTLQTKQGVGTNTLPALSRLH